MKKLFFIVILFCFTSINLHSQWSKKETGFNKRFICSALLDTNTCYLAGDNIILLIVEIPGIPVLFLPDLILFIHYFL